MLGSNWKKRKLLFSLVATLLLLITGLSPGVVHADGEDEEGSDYSFYMKASQLSEAFEQEVSPQSATSSSSAGSSLLMNSQGSRIKTGQAGGLLGYSESTSDQKGVYGWLHSELSTNSASYNYSQLKNISSKNANGDLEETGVLVSYAYYGKTLSDLGFDNTASSGASIGRIIAGSFLYLVYIIASIAPMFFVWGIKLIKLLNPFQLVGAAFAGLNNSQIPGFLGTTVNYVSKIYTALESMSTFVILPVMIGVTVFSIFMFRRTSASKKVIRLAVRALMMFGGVAIIGSTFTGLLNKLDDMTSSGTQYADFVVLSSFVDFESWAQNTRLALPVGGDYGDLGNTFKSTKEGESSMSKSRQSTALLINAMSNNDATLLSMYNSMDASNAFNVFDEANDSIGSGGGKYNTNKQLKATSILVSYLKGELYYSSAYEGYAKADYESKNAESVVNMFTKLPTVLSGKDSDKIGLLGGTNDGIGSTSNNSSIYSAGSLGRTGKDINGFFQSSSLTTTGKAIPTIGSGASSGGLTPMAMYNYLNTKFGSTNLVVYSPVKSSSSYVKESHRSVNFVGGTGALMFIGYVETAVVLIFLATISLIYAFGLIQVSFGSIARILPGIFGSAIGSIGFITKLLVSVVVLLVEIIGTVLLYGITQYLSISVMVNLNTIFQYDKLSISASMMEAVKSIIVIVIMILLMYISFKNRTKFVKAMEETVTNIITKLMGALDSNINEGNALGNNSEAIKSGIQSGTGQNKENNGTGVKDLYTASKANMEKRDRLGQMQGNAPMSKTDKAVGMASTMGRMAGAKSKDTAAEMFGIKGHALDTEMAMEDMKMSALENDTRSAMTAGGNNIQQNEQNADYDPDYDDVNGLSGDGTQAFDDDSGLADYEANDSEQSVVTDDNGNSASGVRGVESSDDFDDFDDDNDFSGVDKDDPRGPKGPKDPKSAGKTIKAGEAATVGAAGALARGNRKNKDDKDKNSDSKSKSKQDTNGKNGKSSDQNKDGKSIKAGESAGKDGVKSGKPGSQNIKPGAAQGNGKKKDQTDADGRKRTSDDNDQLNNGSSLNQRTGKSKTPNVGEAAGSNTGVKPNGASENGAIPGNKRRGNRLDSINTNDSEFDDTDDVMDSDGTESMVFQLNSDNSLSGFDAIDGQSSGQSGKPAGQAKRPGFAQRRLSNTKRRVQKAAESVATVAGAAKEGFGDGRYGETGHDLRKAEKVVRKQAWQANKNQTGNPVTRTYKQAVGAHNMKQTAKNLRSQGQDPSSVLRGGSGYHGSNAGQSGGQNRGPITKFANGSDIRVMRNVPLSKSANSLNLTESTPLSPERVQGRINNLVNDYNVGSYDTYKASLRDASQEVAAYKSDMARAHTALNKAKTGNSFDKNSVAQLQQTYNQAKAAYNQANNRRRELRKNSVALVHTEGMPSSVVTGSKFKGDPIYARNTLNNLAKVQKEQSKLRRSISSSSRYGRNTTKAKTRLNELNVDQSKLQGVLRNSGFDMDYLDSPKSVVKTAEKFENEFKDYIDGKR